MKLRDLVVLLDGTGRDEAKLAVAVGLARRHDAHLTGLCALELLLPADTSFALSGYPDLWALPEFSRKIEGEARTKAALIEGPFREMLRREGLAGDWRLETGPLIQAVARRAQTTDLMVVGQADPDRPLPPAARTLVEDILMTAGRPLLLVPYAGTFETVGSATLIGWTPTRESARAVHDALPLLAPSGHVTVLTVELPGSVSEADAVPTADIAEHLSRHGLAVTAARTVVSDGLPAADVLLDYASDIGADLLVVGGYGHSRTREMIMGGVTRDLLRHMTLPVLMSH
ncbi:MAG TPA: universal stress protein [Rhodopila sp.]|nr:universal stress protein [Rhodopila sp.]